MRRPHNDVHAPTPLELSTLHRGVFMRVGAARKRVRLTCSGGTTFRVAAPLLEGTQPPRAQLAAGAVHPRGTGPMSLMISRWQLHTS